MTLLQIESFCVLAKTLNFTKASEILFVSQPVLSKRIANLEEELGIKLFVRTSHSVLLTEAGALLYKFFVAEKKSYTNVFHQAQRLSRGQKKLYRFGILDNLQLLGGFDVYELVKSIQADNPGIRIELIQRAFPYYYADLVSKRYDLVFSMDDQFPASPDLVFVPLVKCQTNVYYLSAAYPTEPTIRDFKDRDFFIADDMDSRMGVEWATRELIPHLLVQPSIIQVYQMSSAFANVLSGAGVAVADEPAVMQLPEFFRKDIKAVPLTNHKLGVLYLAENSDDVIREFTGRLSESENISSDPNSIKKISKIVSR